MNTIRTRIAPSPTGYLHIGTARTALFNWLFARQNKGAFLLRIEDTDRARSQPEYEKDICEGLRWLGLVEDETVYRQSERLALYERYARQLLTQGNAYYCFCAKEELEKARAEARAHGKPPIYNGACRALDAAAAEARARRGDSGVIRFKTPSATITFNDLIRGEISFDTKTIGDFSIAKNLREPLYNFAAVVDDFAMNISHVIRGEDHIANTPKQIMLQEALAFSRPAYAHVPLILNPDRSKMSKRFEATTVREYREAGYLPEALINFMALLGWHPKGDGEILSRDELVRAFNLSDIQKGGAAFDMKKLNWLNSQYLNRLSDEELVRALALADTPRNRKIVSLAKPRIEKFSDFKALTGFFFELPDYAPELLFWKGATAKETRENLKAIAEGVRAAAERDFTAHALLTALEPLVKKVGTGEILWPLRVALSGQKTSPGPHDIAEALGKEETLRRIKIAIKKLDQ